MEVFKKTSKSSFYVISRESTHLQFVGEVLVGKVVGFTSAFQQPIGSMGLLYLPTFTIKINNSCR